MSEESRSRPDRFATRLADFVIDHRVAVLAVTALFFLFALAGARNLEFANNYRVFFSADNPDLVAFENFQDTYTKNDNLLFVLQPEDGSVFTPELAGAIEKLTADAWKIPYAIRVDSVTNFQHSWADGDDLTVEDLIRDGPGLDGEALAARRDVALAEPLLLGNLISPDAATTGVNVTLQYPEESLLEVPQAVGFARELAAGIEAEHPGVEIALSGVSMLNNAFAEAGQQDSMTLMPLMFAVLLLFMVIVLRSFSGIVATLTVVTLSSATALGLAGWFQLKLNPISVTAPIIIMTLAIADSVHVLTTMFRQMRAGQGKLAALRESMRVNFVPIVITSVTTIVGFSSLNFSDAPPFWHLGNITAVGIFFALIYSMTALPALISFLPLRAPARSNAGRDGIENALGRLADWVTARHRAVLAVTGTAAILLIALIPTIDLNDEWVKYFDHRVEFRGDAEFAMDHLNGIYLLEYSVESGEPGGISDPGYLQKLDGFAAWLREQPEVTHVYSYTDIIKRLNKNMHGDDDAFHAIPDDRELAAQYLLLYELSLPYGLDLNDRISVDKSSTRITASVAEISTVQVRELMGRADEWFAANAPEAMRADATGATVMFSFISQRNIMSMLGGNALAVVLIALIMIAALRSFAIGSLSLIPNALPILITFGLWALLVGQVGMAGATVSATSLGIAVDDTVHLLAKYLRARREKKLDRPEALRYAFQTAGRAIVSTTIILVFGFAVLAFSTFRVNAQMGLLTALTIAIALPVDFLLLPSLLMLGQRARKEVRNHEIATVPAA